MWYVYIMKCNDNSFYTGISIDVEKRLKRHNSSKGARYTRVRRPVELLYTEQFDTKTEAIQREIQIKDFSRQNKIQLIKFGTGQRFSLVRHRIFGGLGINSA
jgi:putative endonuclease